MRARQSESSFKKALMALSNWQATARIVCICDVMQGALAP